jgi:hypothetical protein
MIAALAFDNRGTAPDDLGASRDHSIGISDHRQRGADHRALSPYILITVSDSPRLGIDHRGLVRCNAAAARYDATPPSRH